MQLFFRTYNAFLRTAHWLAALLALVVVYYIISRNGIGMSPDSVDYLSTAENWHNGKGWYLFNGQPLVIFPLLYPSFLSVFLWLPGQSIVAAAPLINGLLLAVAVYLTGKIARKIAGFGRLAAFFLQLVVVFSVAMLDVYTMLWSETLFIVLIVAAMMAIDTYLKKPTFTALITMSGIAAFCCACRFAGVAVVATAGCCILLLKLQTWQTKVRDILVFVIVSVSLMFLNLWRNALVTGFATGIRQKSSTSLAQNIRLFAAEVLAWLHLPITGQAMLLLIGCVVLLLLAFATIGLWLQKKQSVFAVVAIFALIYPVFMIVTASTSRYEPINNRLLSPVYIPLCIVLVFYAKQFLLFGCKRLPRIWASGVVLAVGLLFLLQHSITWYTLAADLVENGIPGYTEKTWNESQMVQFLRKEAPQVLKNSIIYSNGYEAVFFYSHLPCQTLPEAAHTQLVQQYFSNHQPHYLVWFDNDFDYNAIIRLSEIQARKEVTLVRQFTDGAVYWVR